MGLQRLRDRCATLELENEALVAENDRLVGEVEQARGLVSGLLDGDDRMPAIVALGGWNDKAKPPAEMEFDCLCGATLDAPFGPCIVCGHSPFAVDERAETEDDGDAS